MMKGGAIKRAAPSLKTPLPVKKAQFEVFHPIQQETSVQDGFWQDYYPAQATYRPLIFQIPPSNNFMDLSMCTFRFWMKLTKQNGTDIATDLDVGVINNVGHSIIKRFDVKMNDTSVGEPTDLYMYRAYTTNLMNFTQEQKDTYLRVEGWYTDSPGRAKMNQFATGAANTPKPKTDADYNKGYQERTQLFLSDFTKDGTGGGGADTAQAGREVMFCIQPDVDAFKSGRYLVPGVGLTIQIDFNDPQFVLMATAADTHKFEITKAVFRVRHVKAESSVHLDVETHQLQQQHTARYPIRTTKPIRHSVKNGLAVADFTDVFQNAVPDYLTIGMVASNAFNGAYNLNPYYFELFGLQDLRLVVNGIERPLARYEFKSHDGVEGYDTWWEASGYLHRGFTNGIKREEYGQGFALLRFNLTPDGKDAKNYKYDKNEGTLDVHMKFKTALTSAITVLFIPEFENEILVDPNKVVTLAKNY